MPNGMMVFRNPSRFWNINYLQKEIKLLLSLAPENLQATTAVVDQWYEKIGEVVEESQLQETLVCRSSNLFF
jgi:hypothetical protein